MFALDRIVHEMTADDNASESQPKRRRIDIKPDDNRSIPSMAASIEPVNRLCGKFFANKTCIELSKALLGQILCRKLDSGPVVRGRIVETEAYLGGEDKGSNTCGGRRTRANAPVYMKAGTCYMHHIIRGYYCLNFSAEEEEACVLLRAVQPLDGVDHMRLLRAHSRRKTNGLTKSDFKLKELTNGPGKLCMAFGIDKSMNEVDVVDSPVIWLEGADEVPHEDIVAAARVGLTQAAEWTDKPLRFYIRNCVFISKF